MTEEEELLLEWKEAYGYVYYTEVDEQEFIYRPVGMDEYLDLERMAEDFLHLDELLCVRCVLHPILEDWDSELNAGLPRSVATAIREDSGLGGNEEEIALLKIIEEEKDKVYNRFVFQMPLIIKHSFPEFTLKEIGKMSMREQGEYYARSLWMLETFENKKLEAKKD